MLLKEFLDFLLQNNLQNDTVIVFSDEPDSFWDIRGLYVNEYGEIVFSHWQEEEQQACIEISVFNDER